MKATSRADDIICLKTGGVRRKIDNKNIEVHPKQRLETNMHIKTMVHITFDALERHK